jgi:hypothetical protein
MVRFRHVCHGATEPVRPSLFLKGEDPLNIPPDARSSSLRSNIQFWWDHPARTWGPFSREQLVEMVLLVATSLGISPEHARHIQVVFGDHIRVTFPDDRLDHLNRASCLIDYDDKGQVIRTTVILNRSLQVARQNALPPDPARLNCVLETPEEIVLWLLIEELHHAKTHWQARTKWRMEAWEEKYRQYVQRRGINDADPYTFDLSEVAASRVAVLTLAKLLAHRTKARGIYFHSLYQASLEQCRCITSKISENLAKQAYLDEEGK